MDFDGPLVFFLIGLIVFHVALLLLERYRNCNNRTLDERNAILIRMSQDHERFGYNLSIFNRVSYDRHLWALYFGLNPAKLYERYDNDRSDDPA